MPCRDETSGQYYERIVVDTRKVDKLTRMLCAVMGSLSPAQVSSCSQETRDWWKEHQEMDRRRIAREREEARRVELKRGSS